MRQLRKIRGRTQLEVAQGLDIDVAKYRRMESISSKQCVTLNECAQIFDYYKIETGMRELMIFLPKAERDKILTRLTKTCDFLEAILSGNITVRQLRSDATELQSLYQVTRENLKL